MPQVIIEHAGVYDLEFRYAGPAPSEPPYVPPPPKPYPVGKGMYVWQLGRTAGGQAAAIVDRAQAAGLHWVALKVADRAGAYNGDCLALVQALEAARIAVWGWGYVYGDDPAGEARIALRRVQELGLRGWIIDAEHEYKNPAKRAAAERYVGDLHGALPELPLGLASYRYPDGHPELPWDVFLRHCTFHNPQVYWIGATAAGAQLGRSYAQLLRRKDIPVVPVGIACAHPWRVAANSQAAATWPILRRHDDGTVDVAWRPTVVQMDDFHAAGAKLNLPGECWWAWEHAERIPEFWAAISAHDWRG